MSFLAFAITKALFKINDAMILDSPRILRPDREGSPNVIAS
jgi:hypothetical protein